MFRAAHGLFGYNVALEHLKIALEHLKIATQQREVAPKEFPTERTFPFLRLPPELRVMVYKPLLIAGDLSILVVSKLVSHEAVPLLSKVACLRMNLGRPDLNTGTLDLTASITLSGTLTLTAPDYIQHIDFHLDMRTRTGPPIDPKLISCFGGNKTTRKSCIITIFHHFSFSITYGSKEEEIYQAIASLTGFKSLLLMLQLEEYVFLNGYEPLVKGENSFQHFVLKNDYENVFALLQPTLGPADFQKKVDRHFLSF